MSDHWNDRVKAFAKLLYDTSAGCSQSQAVVEYRNLLAHRDSLQVRYDSLVRKLRDLADAEGAP